MEKLRLAIFNTQPPHLYFGGVERRIIETTQRLQKKANITVYSGTKAGFKKATTIGGVDFVPCYSTDRIFPLDNWFFNRSLYKRAATIEADVYEVHTASGYGLLRALKRHGIKKPLIHTIHGVLADEYEQAQKSGYQTLRGKTANRFMRQLAKVEMETAKNATLIVTISEHSLRKIELHYAVDKAKVRIVPNGVDPEKFKPNENQDAAKRQFGVEGKPCVLFVGSLIPRKGLPFLVEAAEKITREYNDVKFLIVGEGPLKDSLIDSLQNANLIEYFRFLGNVAENQLETLYNCADVFALPSIQEGQGIVLLEAQASRKPVVAFNIGGVNEAVVNGETGLLVELDSDALADAILKLLSDKPLREKMGVSGRQFVLKNFTWDVCAEKMLRVYSEASVA